MRPTTLKEIAAWCGGTVAPEYEQVTITSLCHDSREAEAGALFFALEGQNDGHMYVPAAQKQGAVAAVCTHPLEIDFPVVLVEDTRKALRDVAAAYKETLNCTTVAITGSVGKTTTRTMISKLLGEKYHTCSTVKNYNNDIGLPVTIGKSDPDCEMLVLEMGMNHFGEMRQLTAIGRPDLVVITNIGSMHIENLGSREGILKAKLEILEGLHPGGTAVFNGDEPLLWNLRERQVCKTVYFGLENPGCEVQGKDVELRQGSSSFRVTGLGQDFQVELPVSGIHNVHNALAAITVALLCQVPVEGIQKAMAAYENTSQRQQTIAFQDYTIIDDTYNAGPESMEAALRVLGDTSGSGQKFKRIAVLGDMLELGNHANAEHYRIGRVAAYKADLLLTYGPLMQKTIEGAVTGGISQRNAMNFESQEELLNVLRSRAKPGDVLLFKGSHGMHMEKILKAFMDEQK
jgi:UDP-N-acetylmuramoyl-tripeptide--D-alanyl-D-alanine ligase